MLMDLAGYDRLGEVRNVHPRREDQNMNFIGSGNTQLRVWGEFALSIADEGGAMELSLYHTVSGAGIFDGDFVNRHEFRWGIEKLKSWLNRNI